jgi:hypothetical protein
MGWVWMDGFLLVFLIIFAFFVWVVYLSELVKYLLIERYLAAKIGTILVVLVWQVFFITFDCSGFLIFFLNKCFFIGFG